MNQFKKAKQLRSETGQATESITDLTTAGVTQKPENVETSIPKEEAVSQNTETSITIKKTISQNTETPITNEKVSSQNIEPTITIENTVFQNGETPITNEISQNTIEINAAIETKENVSKTSPQLPINTTNSTPISTVLSITEPSEKIIHNQPVVQSTATPVPVPTLSYKDAIPNSTLSMTQKIANNTQEPFTMAPQQNNVPIVQEMVSPNYTAPVVYENRTSQSVAVHPLNEQQPTQEMTMIPQNKTKKKSVPNIFAPKGEAKSMRKSLVLKPTSVKIAENYCEKNGGSFNELIQTLLDNFIDEYGL